MIRTDLALEAAALSGEAELPGISVCRVQKHGLELTTVTVQNEEGARAIGKPPGRYITLETDPIGETALTGTAEAALLGESLSSLLPSEGTLPWGQGLPAGCWLPAMWQAGNSSSGGSGRWRCWRRGYWVRPASKPPG